ncbi:MAG: hypothetical protein ABSH08_07045 [Tepidisphaeraceae bacterium]
MPKRKFLGRFEPRYGVGASLVAEEAKALGREVEDCECAAPGDVDARLAERHASCRRCWDELQLLLGHLPERDRRIVHGLLFRDFYHILELYLCHVRTKHPELSAPNPPLMKQKRQTDDEFSEWLFDPLPKGDSHASRNT